MQLDPDAQLPADTNYTIRFTAPLRDAAGETLPQPEPVAFTTPPVILASSPRGDNNHPANPITIRFDRLMDPASNEAAFQIEPPTPGSFRWEETTLTFVPEAGYLTENVDFTITIADTAVSASGEPVLNQDYTWQFSTKALEDVANFGYGPNAQGLDVNGRRAIQFQAFRRDNLQFRFELYQLTMPQFLERYSAGFHGWIWSDQEDTSIDLTGTALLAEQMTSATPLQDSAMWYQRGRSR